MSRTCIRCNETYELNAQFFRKDRIDGRTGAQTWSRTCLRCLSLRQCISCDRELPLNENNFRLGVNRDKNGKTRETYRKVCRDCERSRVRERVYFLTRGITTAQRNEMLAAQGGKCLCCGSEESGSKKGWHVDHCHRTGAIRGVLCANCNVALGHVDDSIEKLQMLINYLKSHGVEGATTIPQGSTPQAIGGGSARPLVTG